MKIGILTILNVNNYGAELQCCALCRKLTKMGYNAEVINYLFGINPSHDFRGEKLTVPISLKQKVKVSLLPIVQNLFCMFHQKNKKLRNKRFEEFHEKYNHLTSSVYPSVRSLYDAKFDYDVLCIGSDQVWNYEKGYSLEPFFACFDKNGTKKISYASSIGLSFLSKEAERVFKKELSGFAHLSVREQQASELLENLLDRDVDVVLDPTLILDNKEWLEVAKFDMCPKEKYILVYIVTIKPCDYVLEVARHIAKERNLTKSFYSVIKSQHSTNSRLTSILKKLNLENRILPVGSPLPKISDVDYTIPAEKLKEERYHSIEYIKKALFEK